MNVAKIRCPSSVFSTTQLTKWAANAVARVPREAKVCRAWPRLELRPDEHFRSLRQGMQQQPELCKAWLAGGKLCSRRFKWRRLHSVKLRNCAAVGQNTHRGIRSTSAPRLVPSFVSNFLSPKLSTEYGPKRRRTRSPMGNCTSSQRENNGSHVQNSLSTNSTSSSNGFCSRPSTRSSWHCNRSRNLQTRSVQARTMPAALNNASEMSSTRGNVEKSGIGGG
mmetsp:Transcript_97062/g.274316  ORF Transcript_97062/g.274316 Transcript_97062/m.274316 type:complete len:222 (+) Transcript_97062:943-1608(+)